MSLSDKFCQQATRFGDVSSGLFAKKPSFIKNQANGILAP